MNSSLTELNERISNHTRYYTAAKSRDLIDLINDIFELIYYLRNTKYEFKIERSYYFYLKEALNYLKNSGGTTVPNNVKQITIVKYEKIFKFIVDDNKYIEIQKETNDLLSKVSNRNTVFYKYGYR